MNGRGVADGYVVATGVFDEDLVARARNALDCIFDREAPAAAERNWSNSTHRVAYMLPAKDTFFLEFVQHAPLLRIVRDLLGDDCVLAALNGLSPTPMGEAQALHTDQAEPIHGAWLYVNAVCVLDDFTDANGATRLVPGSWLRSWTPAVRSEAEAEAITVCAPAGSVIAYNGALLHACGANRTTEPRRAIHAFFAKPWVEPHWDFRRSLPVDVIDALTDDERRLLGFESRVRRFDLATGRVVPAC